MTIGVRERAREALRADLAQSAVDLLAERGFDAITVEELAREIGISRATFFRYFGSKEDLIVLAIEPTETSYADALTAFPRDSQGSVWVALRAAFEPAISRVNQNPAKIRARLQMIRDLPALRAKLAEKRGPQMKRVSEALQDRIGDPLSAQIFTAAAYSALDIAWELWGASSDASFKAILDDVFVKLADSN